MTGVVKTMGGPIQEPPKPVNKSRNQRPRQYSIRSVKGRKNAQHHDG